MPIWGKPVEALVMSLFSILLLSFPVAARLVEKTNTPELATADFRIVFFKILPLAPFRKITADPEALEFMMVRSFVLPASEFEPSIVTLVVPSRTISELARVPEMTGLLAEAGLITTEE